MNNYRLTGLHQAQESMLELVAQCTQCAIGLYEPTDNGEIIATHTFGNYEPYCAKLQSFPKGAERCRRHHEERALEVIECGYGALTLCPAGVFNQTLPVLVDKKIKAVLAYGQMWILTDDRCDEARRRHEETLAAIRPLSQQDRLELQTNYSQVKQLSPEELQTLNQKLAFLHKWLYCTLTEEVKLDRYTNNLLHDLDIWLQAVLSYSEDLLDHCKDSKFLLLSRATLLTTAEALLGSELGMRTVIWNAYGHTPIAYDFRLCDLKEIAEEAILVYKIQAERKGVKIQSNIKPPSKIRASRSHLQHAVNNLVHNAVKYSYHGRPERERYVDIIGEACASYYELTISNYGVGVATDELSHIFKAGYRGRLAQVEHRSGSGMGLTIAKEIIKQHQGFVTLDSQPLGGEAYLTTVTVRLPRE
jgi:signal transduction histidine kinase